MKLDEVNKIRAQANEILSCLASHHRDKAYPVGQQTRLERSYTVDFYSRGFNYHEKYGWAACGTTTTGWRPQINTDSFICDCPDQHPRLNNPPCKHLGALARAVANYTHR